MKRRILIVEDQASNRELLTDWLEGQGCEVLAVANLEAGLAAFQREAPDAVLLDVDLGDDDGLRLALWVRQHPRLHRTPIIAVTAHAMLGDKERVFESGCNACVPKPIDFLLLRSTLDIWLGPRDGVAAESGGIGGPQE